MRTALEKNQFPFIRRQLEGLSQNQPNKIEGAKKGSVLKIFKRPLTLIVSQFFISIIDAVAREEKGIRW